MLLPSSSLDNLQLFKQALRTQLLINAAEVYALKVFGACTE
jgi:hypothetical protein